MSSMYCQNCGDPLEVTPLNRYKANSPKLTRHLGEGYLSGQRMSGLDAEDKEQLRNWAHPIVAVDASGKPFSANFHPDSKLGRQFK